MATAVDVCNLGLSHIGARAQISSISPPDGTVEAGLCARFYPLVRREMLEASNWSFATKRTLLAEVVNDSTQWLYAYTLPSDFIKAQRILKQEDLTASAGPHAYMERQGAFYVVEGNVIRTNEPEAVLLYTKETVDTNVFSPSFVAAAGMLMAAYLSGPIIKGVDGARAGVQWRQAAMDLAASAAATNADNSNQSGEFVPSQISARA